MAASVTHPSLPVGPRPVPLRARLFGLGSVFGKTIRDSRRATIIVAAVVGLITLAAGQVMSTQYATVEGRKELLNLVETMPPILQGLAGRPVNVDTLGGFMTWKYGVFFPLITGLWSILALSGTLASEVRRGSIEFVAATPQARRRIAAQKLLGHVFMVALAMTFVFAATALTGQAMADLPQDRISVFESFSNAVWMGLMALVAGAVAFAISPFLGRAAAAAIAGAAMFAGFILNGYQEAIPQFAPLANLTWFGWTRDHMPLAGREDWSSLALTALVAIVLFAIGVEAFARRDLGSTTAVPTPGWPRVLLGLRGPGGRAASDMVTTAAAWGIGLAIFGAMMASSSKTFSEQISKSPELLRLFDTMFKGTDISSAGGFLQLMFIDFGLVLAGLAAATLVGTWASDETSGRLEMLISTPLDRVRWAVSGGVGIAVGIAIFTLVSAVGVAAGVASTGENAATPVAGVLALALYAAAMAGIGLAVGGLFGTSYAAPTVAVVTLVMWLGGILAKDLGLPDLVQQLTLTSHLGQPMIGRWDVPGIVACVVLALGGLALGAAGIARRDVAK